MKKMFKFYLVAWAIMFVLFNIAVIALPKEFTILGVTYENGDNAEARVAPTAFAKGRRAWSKRELKTADGDYAGRWWLRSMGRHPNRAAHVHSTGALRDSHVTSYNHLFGVMTVRPALWVKAEAVSGK